MAKKMIYENYGGGKTKLRKSCMKISKTEYWKVIKSLKGKSQNRAKLCTLTEVA